MNAADQSTVRLLGQNIVQTCLTLAAVGALGCVGHATFGRAKQSVQKSELVVFRETQQKFDVFVEHVSAICAQHLHACFPASLTSLPCPGVRVYKKEDVLQSGH